MARFITRLATFLAATSLCGARRITLPERGVPANATGVKTITSPQGASISFKQPGKQGVCETTEGVDDYAGYISLNPTVRCLIYRLVDAETNSEL
jgi:hypothetical protein